MSLAERGLYRELLDFQAIAGGPFKYDPAKLARQLRCDRAEVEAMWSTVSALFERDGNGCWFNAKIQAEIDRSEALSEQGRKAGKASAEARAKQRLLERSEPTPVGTAVEIAVATSPTPTPTQTQKKKTPPKAPPRGGRSSKPRWNGSLPDEWPPELAEAMADFKAHRDEIRKPITPRAGTMLLRQIEDMGPARAVAAIQHTIANGWQGLREPEQPRANGPKPGYRQTAFDPQMPTADEKAEFLRRATREP
jgi:uncharacterized protein YdaU (DUF1376 family)